MFFNQHGTKLSRGGIAWIIRKYQASTDDPQLADVDVSPHTLRHSNAPLHAGVDITVIALRLGHEHSETARTDQTIKQRALDPDHAPGHPPGPLPAARQAARLP